jgi:hypothetical protein
MILLEDIKDESRPNQESARLYCEFYFKIKHDTKLNKIIFMKNKNYSFLRNKELIK